MEVILLVAIFVIISYVSSAFNKKDGGKPSVPVTEEKQEEPVLFEGQSLEEILLGGFTEQKKDPELEQQPEPVQHPEPARVKPIKVKPAQQPKPVQKPVKKTALEEKPLDEPAKEKIDPKKLVIYSEIMKPKFKE